MARKPKSIRDRLLSRVVVLDGCWEWSGYIDNYGYGRIMTKDGPQRTHRVSYCVHHGEIPSGLSVLHHCDNRKCINPAHIYVGTQKQNMADKVGRGRALTGNNRGTAHPAAKIADADVYEIRKSKDSNPTLAKKYGLTPAAIGMVKRRRTWSHLPEKDD